MGKPLGLELFSLESLFFAALKGIVSPVLACRPPLQGLGINKPGGGNRCFGC